MAKGDRDPPWVPRHKLSTMGRDWSRSDRVIIYDGNGPSAQDWVWSSGASRVAWIDVSGRGKARVPKDARWFVYRRSVKHSDLGGVTDGIFSCFLVSKFGDDKSWSLAGTGIRATLRQVIDPTNGGRTVEPPKKGLEGSPKERLNTAAGLLEWNRRLVG